MRITRIFFVLAMIMVLVCDGENRSSAQSAAEPVASPFRTMLAHLNSMAGQFEDQVDVKCWTSFKQLETYVAGCQLAPYSTHLKSQVVIDLIDQVWKIASTGLMNGDVVTGDEFDQTVKAYFQWNNIKFVSYSVRFGGHELIIPFQDIDNYLGTVEPIRLL